MFQNQSMKKATPRPEVFNNQEFEEFTNLIESSAECRNLQKEKPKTDYTYLTNESTRPLPFFPEVIKRDF